MNALITDSQGYAMTIDSLNWGDLKPRTISCRILAEKTAYCSSKRSQIFKIPFQPMNLAGLAMEAEIESRIVSDDGHNNWQVDHGPFDDFSANTVKSQLDTTSASGQQLVTPN